MESVGPPAPPPSRALTAGFLTAASLLALVFFAVQTRRANVNPMWWDEVGSLFLTLRGPSCGDLLVRGVYTEASGSPLYLILAKGLDQSRVATGYFGLSVTAYYRLLSNAATTLLGLLAVLIAWKKLSGEDPRTQSVRLFLLLAALGSFYFQRYVYHYAGEMRAYSLWNSLWLLCLVLATLVPRPTVALGVLLCLVAVTAVASCFQLFALGVAFAAAERGRGRPWSEILGSGLKLFGPAAALALYYALLPALPVDFRGPEWGTWPRFLRFWTLGNAGVWLLAGAACYACWKKPPLRPYAWGPAAILILLALGPLIYAVTRARGYLYSSRQYLYNDLIYPVVLIGLAHAWPHVVARGRRAVREAAAMTLAGLLVAGLAVVTSINVIGFHPPAKRMESEPRWGGLVDPGGRLGQEARSELPGTICVPADYGETAELNVRLLAEWLPVRYPEARIGTKSIRLRGDGGNWVLEAGGEGPCPEGYREIPVRRPGAAR